MNNQVRTHLLNAKRAALRTKDTKSAAAIDKMLTAHKSNKVAGPSRTAHSNVYVHSSLRDGNQTKKNDGKKNVADDDLSQLKVAELKQLAIQAGMEEGALKGLKKDKLVAILNDIQNSNADEEE